MCRVFVNVDHCELCRYQGRADGKRNNQKQKEKDKEKMSDKKGKKTQRPDQNRIAEDETGVCETMIDECRRLDGRALKSEVLICIRCRLTGTNWFDGEADPDFP